MDWRREEQAGAGRLQEVEGCLAPLYMTPRWVRVLDWRREEQAGAGRLQEVEGYLAPMYITPPGALRVLYWERERAVLEESNLKSTMSSNGSLELCR